MHLRLYGALNSEAFEELKVRTAHRARHWKATIYLKVKIKGYRNRPGVAQRVPGGLGSQISWHLAHEDG